jgi:hypothetical protein
MSYIKKPVNPEAPSNNKSWSKNDDATLKEMASKGSSTSQIAIALGRTKSSVWARKYVLGLKIRLSSSRGNNIYAPVSVGTKKGKNVSPSTTKKRTKKNIKITKTLKETQVKRSEKTLDTLNLQALSKLAKESGAKIVITFE